MKSVGSEDALFAERYCLMRDYPSPHLHLCLVEDLLVDQESFENLQVHIVIRAAEVEEHDVRVGLVCSALHKFG